VSKLLAVVVVIVVGSANARCRVMQVITSANSGEHHVAKVVDAPVAEPSLTRPPRLGAGSSLINPTAALCHGYG